MSAEQLLIGVRFIDWDKAKVIAKLGDIVVEKTARLSSCELACYESIENQQAALACAIAMKARELDRDVAYKLHGDDFRKHCHFQSNFWRPMTDEEMSAMEILA